MKVKTKLNIGKYLWGILLFAILSSVLHYGASAQISGMVYRDYNSSGTRTTAFNASSTTNLDLAEPLVSGVIVNAYADNNQVVASYTTTLGSNATVGTNYPFTGPNFTIPASGAAYNGIPGSNTGFVPSGTRVRLEFVIPGGGDGCSLDRAYDYSSTGVSSVQGSSVQFITSGASANNVLYGINDPSDYNNGSSTLTDRTMIFTSRQLDGDPLNPGTGTGNSGRTGREYWFMGLPYGIASGGSRNPSATYVLEGHHIGTTWGIAYSKQSGKVFTSALMKRFTGLGPMGSGGIYLLTPVDRTVTNPWDLTPRKTFDVNQFYDLDANGYRTRAISGLPYGEGSSFTITGTSKVTFNGPVDPVSGQPAGMGVIGTNAERGLPDNPFTGNFDPAAIGQVGKVSIGDIDISEDGRYLFVMNLYSRKLLRLELNDPANPTSVVNVQEYTLPAVATPNGELRPWGLKFYRGKVYVGAVASAEYGPPRVERNADLHAYVFELNDAVTGAATFATAPVLDYPLDFRKGATARGQTGAALAEYYQGWSDDMVDFFQAHQSYASYPTPLIGDIEFNERGDMLMSFLDRSSLQIGHENYLYPKTDTRLFVGLSDAQTYVAGKNVGCNGFTLEYQGRITSEGLLYTGRREAIAYGPGEEGLFLDHIEYGHPATSLGALAVLPGSQEVLMTRMDPIDDLFQGGFGFVSTVNGVDNRGYIIYDRNTGMYGKANGMGDIELLTPLAPMEIGNYIWKDLNRDGIQDPSEPALQGVTVQLLNAEGTVIGTTTTNANGQYYFSSVTVAELVPFSSYTVRVSSLGSHASVSGLALDNIIAITPGETSSGNSGTTLHNNDARMVGIYPTIALTTGDWGENNHTYDFGFAECPSYGVTVTPQTQTVCAGQPIPPFTASSTLGGAASYQWYGPMVSNTNGLYSPVNGATTASYTPTVTNAGQYYYAVEVGSAAEPGCKEVVYVSLTVSANPAPVISGNRVICVGQSTTLSVNNCTGSILWSTGATTGSITVNPGTTTNYSVTCTQNGCPATVNAAVTVNNPPVLTVNNPTVCNGASAVLTVSGCNGGTLLWGTGETTPSITVYAWTTINYAVTCTVGSCVTEAISTVTVTPKPNGGIGGAACGTGTGVTITGFSPAGGTWAQVGTTPSVASVNASGMVTGLSTDGTYNFTYTVNGCADTVSVLKQASAPVQLCTGESVTLTAPAGSGNVTWYKDGTQIAGATGLTYQATEAGSYTYEGLNADGCEIELCCPVVVTGCFDLALRKVLESGGKNPVVSPGDNVTFTIEVINQGTVGATNITVVDYIPDGLILNDGNWTQAGTTATLNTPIAVLAAGATATRNITFTVSASARGSIINRAEISGAKDEDGNEVEDTDSTPDTDPDNDGTPTDDATGGENGDEDDHDIEEITVKVFDLALRKTLTTLPKGATVTPGSTVEFTLTVINQGNVDATNVRLVDYIPDNLTLADANWTQAGTTATLNTPIASLAAGAEITRTITFTVNAGFSGIIRNEAEISGAENGEGLEDIDSTPDSTKGNDGTAKDDVVNEDHKNNPAQDEDDHDYEEITVTPTPIFDLALRKTLTTLPKGATVTPGSTVEFTLTVINQGNVDATNVRLVDYIPDNLTLADGNWTQAGTTATLNTPIAALAAGATATRTITFTVNAGFSGIIRNEAEISGADNAEGLEDIDSTPDSTKGNDGTAKDDVVNEDHKNNPAQDEDDHDYEEITVTPTPIFDLALRKTLTTLPKGATVTPGSTVEFTLTVINQGNVDATNVRLVDYIPDNLTLADGNWTQAGTTATLNTPIAALAAGATATRTITFTVNAGFSGIIRNEAEISGAENAEGLEDIDSTPDSTKGNDGTAKDDVVNEDHKNNPAQDEDDHDYEEITVTEICKQPLLSVHGDVDCNDGGAWSFTISTNGSVNLPTGVTQSGSKVTVPASMNTVSITATSGCGAVTEAITVTKPVCPPVTCVEPVQLSVGTPSTVCSGSSATYSVSFVSNGTVSSNAGTVGTNVITGIPVGTAVIVTATKAGCGTLTMTVSSPAMFDCPVDPCEQPNPRISHSVICNGDGTYSIYYTAEAGITVTSSAGRFTNLTGPVTLTITNTVCNETSTVEIVGPDCETPVFDLALRKVLESGVKNPVVSPGDNVTFTIEVLNQGTVGATNITVVDYIPDGLILNDGNWTQAGTTATLNTPIAVLGAGATATRNITFTVSASARGSIINRAEISGAKDEDGNEVEDTDSTPDTDPDNDGTPTDDATGGENGDEDDHDIEEITVKVFDLALRKTLTTLPKGATVTPGSTVEFTLTVINQGNVNATNVRLVDYIPDNLTLADGNWTQTGTTATLNTPIASLAAGAEITRTITFTVNAGFSGIIRNEAEISGAENGEGLEDIDSTPDSTKGNDGTAKDDVVNEDHKNNPAQDEDDHDYEEITVTEICKQPLLSVHGDVDCNDGGAWSFTISTNGSVNLPTGVTQSGTKVTVPASMNTVSITATSGCGAVTEAITVSQPVCPPVTCVEPVQLSVGTPSTVCNGTTATYSVSFVSNGTVSSNAGTVGTNVITGIPVGTAIIITATKAGCGTMTMTVSSPAMFDCPVDPCEQPNPRISHSVICNGDGTYSIYYTAEAGITVTSSAGRFTNLTGPVTLTLTNTVCNETSTVEIVGPDCEISVCKQPLLSVHGDVDCIVSCVDNAVVNGTFDTGLNGWTTGPGWNVRTFGDEKRAANDLGETNAAFNSSTGSLLSQSLANAYINSEGYMKLDFDFRFTYCNGRANGCGSRNHASLEVMYDGVVYARFANGVFVPISGQASNSAILATNPGFPVNTATSMIHVNLLIPTSNPNGVLSFVHNKGGGEDDVELDNISVERLCETGTNGGWSFTISTNGTVNLPAGVTMNGSKVTVPASMSTVSITATSGCGAVTEAITVSRPECPPVTCVERVQLSVGTPSAVCNGTSATYSVSFVSNGTVSSNAGTVGTNVITGIPVGTAVIITATKAGCGTMTMTVSSPAMFDCPVDPCEQPNPRISHSVICNGDGTYSIYYTAEAGITVTSSAGRFTNLTGPVTLTITNTVCNETSTVEITGPGCETLVFDLALRKTMGAGSRTIYKIGDVVTFDITVFNQGTVTATSVDLVDYIPGGLTLQDANWTLDGDKARWDGAVTNLLPGTQRRVSISFLVNSSATTGVIINTAEISGSENALGLDDIDSDPDDIKDNDGPVKNNEIGENGKTGGDEDDHDIEPITICTDGKCVTVKVYKN